MHSSTEAHAKFIEVYISLLQACACKRSEGWSSYGTHEAWKVSKQPSKSTFYMFWF